MEGITKTYDFGHLPYVPLLKVLSYLNMTDRVKCASVCKTWHDAVNSPLAWKNIKFSDWAYLKESALSGSPCYSGHHPIADEKFWILLNEGYITMTGKLSDIANTTPFCQDFVLYRDVIIDYKILIGCLENILPKFGSKVCSLYLGGNGGLTDYLLNIYLLMCPNVGNLDVRYTSLSDKAFKGLENYGACQKISSLNLLGCNAVSDRTILNLVRCWGYEENESAKEETSKKGESSEDLGSKLIPFCSKSVIDVCKRYVTRENVWFTKWPKKQHIGKEQMKKFTFPIVKKKYDVGLKSLNLTGCNELTDRSLMYLSKCKRISELEFLNVSACTGFTSKGLRTLVNSCPKLKPENLYYCDLIYDGPFSNEANGCQTENEACCCLFECY